jgi:hypothetical protein
MSILYGEAKKILSQYSGRGGKCPSDAEIDLFCRQVFQYMLFSGQHGSLRKFCFNAIKGCFTIPYELEVPLKVKIDGAVGTVWNRWFEYYNIGELDGCVPASDALYEEPNTFPTVYDLPNTHCRVGVLGTAEESADAHLIVTGVDASGREIITDHQGEKITGELLRIKKCSIRYTNVQFAKITGITKTKTNGYVQLLWVRPELNTRGFLSDYSPYEEAPQYRRFKLTTPNCGPCIKVSVLGKIRLKDHYGDNEIIPFDNLYALQLAGQMQNSQYNNDPAMAEAKDKTLQDVIMKENEYKRIQPGSPVDIFYPLSAGAIKGIV